MGNNRSPNQLEVSDENGTKFIKEPREIAEEIKKACENKSRVVKKAIGKPRGNYVAET